MREFRQFPPLAIIGMAVQGERFDTLDALGAQIFHGRDHLVSNAHEPRINRNRQSEMERVIHALCPDSVNVGVIAFPSLDRGKIAFSDNAKRIHFLPDPAENLVDAWTASCEWLSDNPEEFALILEDDPAQETVFGLLLSTEDQAMKTAQTSFAKVTGVPSPSERQEGSSLKESFAAALDQAKIAPGEVGLVVLPSSLETASELGQSEKLIAALPASNGRTCALSGSRGGLQSMIKSVWCLNHRLIPGTSDWQAPEEPAAWQGSPYYVPAKSRPWFLNGVGIGRVAVTLSAHTGEPDGLFVLREGDRTKTAVKSSWGQEPLVIFPVGGRTRQELITHLSHLQDEVSRGANLKALSAHKMLPYHAKHQTGGWVASILGSTREAVLREITFALKGIPVALDKSADWQTPQGSYFAPAPLGNAGTVSFVYPGAFNTYPGVAQDVLYLFPTLKDRMEAVSKNFTALLNEKLLYPRRMTALSPSELSAAEGELVDDPLTMLTSGITLSTLFTLLLHNVLGVHASSAFGYSLGEISMMFANGVWTQVDEANATLQGSPLFHTRLTGPKNAVREHWNLPPESLPGEPCPIWENYILMSSPEDAKVVAQAEPRVFITHINTPGQIVIGGDPAACQRMIARLGCRSLQAPFNTVLHCEAMRSEYQALYRLVSWPASGSAKAKFYTAAANQPVPLTQSAIAEQIAAGLCHQLDFTRLVNQVYADGARVFIELGAGSNCTRWIDETLKDKPHAAFSVNRKGLDDHTAVSQLLARLISQNIPVSLSALGI
ncbi:MAG: hypothetical protein P1P73_04715 [Brevefilum sp.]|nr:hypothetical protein [Brevefilum sp.]MDW7754987.1 hypothetical protein [Brevefilum sp.]